MKYKTTLLKVIIALACIITFKTCNDKLESTVAYDNGDLIDLLETTSRTTLRLKREYVDDMKCRDTIIQEHTIDSIIIEQIKSVIK